MLINYIYLFNNLGDGGDSGTETPSATTETATSSGSDGKLI